MNILLMHECFANLLRLYYRDDVIGVTHEVCRFTERIKDLLMTLKQDDSKGKQ